MVFSCSFALTCDSLTSHSRPMPILGDMLRHHDVLITIARYIIPLRRRITIDEKHHPPNSHVRPETEIPQNTPKGNRETNSRDDIPPYPRGRIPIRRILIWRVKCCKEHEKTHGAVDSGIDPST